MLDAEQTTALRKWRLHLVDDEASPLSVGTRTSGARSHAAGPFLFANVFGQRVPRHSVAPFFTTGDFVQRQRSFLQWPLSSFNCLWSPVLVPLSDARGVQAAQQSNQSPMSLTSDASSPRSYVSPRISTPQTNAGPLKPLLGTPSVVSQAKVRREKRGRMNKVLGLGPQSVNLCADSA